MQKPSIEKETIRSSLIKIRASIPKERKIEASKALFSNVASFIHSYHLILSFNSFGTEIDTSSLNIHLEKEKKLLLPKITEDHLSAYAISNLQKQLLPSFGKLNEPNPIQCEKIPLENIACVLVPGLGFDRYRRRIGYGKGHYDRLIAQLKRLPSPPLTIGLGFKEQFYEGSLPHEEHDMPLDQLLLL
jgi:5-formyltetrahydrofolate cyclo-ligase